MSATIQTAEESRIAEHEESLRRMVPARLRTDLVISKQLFKGEEYFVVKDPLALTYHRFGPEEAFLVSLLDGKRELEEICSLFRKEYPNWEIELAETAQFINQLGQNGLLNISAKRFVDFAKSKPRGAQNLLTLWLKLVSKLIFLKIPLHDPSPWLGGFAKRMRWAWSPWFVCGCIAFFAWTLFWLYVNRTAFANNDVNFFSPENLFLIWIEIILIKSCHEVGHASTSRHFGAEVHEMGACIICFTPCGYVETSDAYMMKYKRHKIYTVIAGIFTEFIIAAIAAHIWLYAEPGLFKNLAFNAMLVASINTLFFNMNPLMKFDGYYVISDLLEIPNLRTKATAYTSFWIQKNLFGIRNHMLEGVFEDESNSRVFLVYSVAAFAYMAFIIYSMSQMFALVLQPYGLGQFGLALGFFVQFSFIGFPIIKVLLDAFGATARHHIERIEPMRATLLKRILPAALAIAAILLFPTRYKIERQGFVSYENNAAVSCPIGGIIDEVFVQTGDKVEEGQLLARILNGNSQAAVEITRLERDRARLTYGAMQSISSSGNLSEAAAALESAETVYQRAKNQSDMLEVRAPISGYVLTPDFAHAKGKPALPDHEVVRIGSRDLLRVQIPLTESEVKLVEAGSLIKGRWLSDGYPFQAELESLPERQAHISDYHPSMLAIFGGPAPLEGQQTMIEPGLPSYRIFIAEAPLPNHKHDQLAQEGMRLRLTVYGKKATNGEKLWRRLVSFWDNRLRSLSG